MTQKNRRNPMRRFSKVWRSKWKKKKVTSMRTKETIRSCKQGKQTVHGKLEKINEEFNLCKRCGAVIRK